MVKLGNKTEFVRCPQCKNKIKSEVISEYLGTPSIKGTKVYKDVKLEHHKKDGFFSRKCGKSGSTLTLSIWHQSDKVKKTKCKFCKQNVWAFIINTYSRNNGYHRPVTRQTSTTVLKLLHHKKFSRKCRGTDKIIKETVVNLIDNCHP